MPSHVRTGFLLATALAAVACSTQDRAAGVPAAAPVALPDVRHGHRIERLPQGWLCFGGFSRAADDRGTREAWLLPHGATIWHRRADLPQGQAFGSSTTCGDDAIAIGTTTFRYSLDDDRWHALTPANSLPESHFAAARHGDRVYVLGGFPQVESGLRIVDLTNGTVAAAEPPPSFGSGDHLHFVASVAGALHVLGGMKSEPWGMSSEHWTLRDDGWHREADLPTPMWAKFGACATRGDSLYLFSDFGGYRLDARAGTWHGLAALPEPIVLPALVDDGCDLWIVGGRTVEPNGLGKGRVLWRYDVAADRWHDHSP